MATINDFFPAAGTPSHSNLSGRDTANQHTIGSVTGLQPALDLKAPLTGLGTSGTWPISVTGSSSSWSTERTLTFTGDLSGSRAIDGTSNATVTLTLANSGVTAGTYGKVTVDAKGRVTTGAALVAADIPFKPAILVSSNITLVANSVYHISGNRTLTLPTGTGSGATIRLTKEIDSTVTINRGGSELIKWTGGTDTSVLFNINSEIIFTRNGASQWEI